MFENVIFCGRCAYLRFKHGSAVHRVGRRSPLSLLSFALNFCKLKHRCFNAETCTCMAAEIWRERGRTLQLSKQSLTLQVVVCYKPQRHHEGQFLRGKNKNSFITRTGRWQHTGPVTCQSSAGSSYLWVLLFLGSGSWRQRRSGGGGEADNGLLLCCTSWFNSLLRGRWRREDEKKTMAALSMENLQYSNQRQIAGGIQHSAIIPEPLFSIHFS